MSEAQRIVELFMVKLVKDTKASLVNKEKQKAAKFGSSYNGNSRLWGTIKSKTIEEAGLTKVQLKMEDYYYWVDAGRKSGDVASSADISGWIKRKGLNPVKIIEGMRQEARDKRNTKKRVSKYKPIAFKKAVEQMDYLVRRKLTAKGYTGNQFYSEVINDGRVEKLKKDYKDACGKDLLLEVKTAVKK
jgi:hypothetical protein